jgi:dethiobiotin synthetase
MRIFVTGTDTGVGKTLVAAALLHKCRERGWTASGMKPVAAGSEDVDVLIAAGNLAVDRKLMNPYPFHDPIAPHIAAEEAGVVIDLHHIADCYRQISAMADAVVVEGAGGFLVPLGAEQDSSDLAKVLGLPLVLVVGMRLGCINHALLTQEAIAGRGLVLAGWVANRVDPHMDRFEENLAALRQRLAAPLLGVVPCLDPPDPIAAADYLMLPAG